jgi:hypothetical protein
MLRKYRVAAQLVASRVVLSAIDLVICLYIQVFCVFVHVLLHISPRGLSRRQPSYEDGGRYKGARQCRAHLTALPPLAPAPAAESAELTPERICCERTQQGGRAGTPVVSVTPGGREHILWGM